MRPYAWLGIAILTAMLAFAGCKGDDGAQGPAGPAGPPVAFTTTSVETCIFCHTESGDVPLNVATGSHAQSVSSTRRNVAITSVDTTGGTLKVTVVVTNESDASAVTTFAGSDIRFTWAELDENSATSSVAAASKSFRWTPHITSTETPTAGVGTGDGSAETQATYQRADDTEGTFDASGSATGTYVYTFGVTGLTLNTTTTGNVQLSNVSTYTVGTPQRIGVQISGGVTNAIFDWTASASLGVQTATGTINNGTATGTLTNQIVDTAACNECHNADNNGDGLAMHGGGRRLVEFCVTCHNYDTTDANSDNTVDMRVFIHKIHRGKNLPSVQAGGEYAIWGHNDSKANYSTGAFPQEITNCTKCHASTVANADNWKTVPTAAVCGSCHDDVNFTTGENHPPGAKTDAQCASCHVGDPTDGIAVRHRWPDIMAKGATWAYTINSVTYDSTTGAVAVNFQVENPVGTTVALDSEPWIQGGDSRLAIGIGWKGLAKSDYTNAGAGQSAPGSPYNINVVNQGVLDSGVTDNGDGTYSVSATLPAEGQAAGTGIAILEGHPAVKTAASSYDRIPVTSAFQEFAISDTAAVPRPAVVDVSKCSACHDTLTLHGENRTMKIEVCATCHNSANTDIARRPTDGTTPVDNKVEEAIDFKRMIHRIHAGRDTYTGSITVYGFGGSANTFAGEFPPGTPLNSCTVCHTSSGYQLPLPDGLEGTTVMSGVVDDQSDDINISPTASTCSACHDTVVTQGHMEAMGASFGVTEAGILGY